MLTRDPYDILGVSPTATDDQVKHAYRELAKKYHPDYHTGNPLAELAQEKFTEVQEAYDTVMKERAAGIPHSYNNNSWQGQQGGYGQNQGYGQNYDPYGGFYRNGYGNNQNQNQNQNNPLQDYERRANQYGGTRGDTDPCSCCLDLWCLDSCCECMGGDLVPCC